MFRQVISEYTIIVYLKPYTMKKYYVLLVLTSAILRVDAQSTSTQNDADEPQKSEINSGELRSASPDMTFDDKIVRFYPPSVASMMKYVDYPVSPNTGIPDISIPLFTIQSGKLKLPITLSFHIDDYARINQIPSAVGAGWSLSTDLQVSREINGADDFVNGYYTQSHQITDDSAITDNLTRITKYLNLYTNNTDGEPDKFYYKLLDKSGAFYFDKNQDAITVPLNSTKIQKTRDGFTITDTDGTKYYYYGTIDKIQTGHHPAIAWRCRSIVAPNNVDSIYFEYASETYLTESSNEKLEIYDKPDDALISHNPFVILGETNLNGAFIPSNTSFAKLPVPRMVVYSMPYESYWLYSFSEGFQQFNFMDLSMNNRYSTSYLFDSNYIKAIYFKGGVVRFSYRYHSTNDHDPLHNLHALETIKVYDGQNRLQKTISFDQTNIGYSRNLDSFIVDGEKYDCKYGSSHLVRVMSDYWGYEQAGGYGDNVSYSIPKLSMELIGGTHYYDGTKVTRNEIKDIGYCSEESIHATKPPYNILTLTYPTGGKTIFTVENHKSYGLEKPHRTGGCRIQKISYYDSDNKLLKENEYKYGKDECGYGSMRSPITFDIEYGNCCATQTVTYYDFSNGLYGNIGSIRKRTIFGHPTTKQHFDGGCPVAYSEVAVYDSQPAGGKTVYYYDTSSHFRPIPATPENPYPLEPELWDVGMLDSVAYFRRNGDEYDWIKAEKYKYNRLEKTSIEIPRARVWPTTTTEDINGGENVKDLTSLGPGTPPWVFTYEYKPLKVGCMQQTDHFTYTRGDNEQVLKESVHYRYDNPNPNLPTQKTSVTSSGETLNEYILYAQDYTNDPWYLKLNNIIDLPIEKAVTQGDRLVAGSALEYDSTGSIVKVRRIENNELDKSEFRLSNKLTPGNYTNSKGVYSLDSDYKERISINYYSNANQNHKIKEIRELGQPVKCYLWSYMGEYLIAEIINASYLEVSALLGESRILNIQKAAVPSNSDMTAINDLRSQLPQALITTATYIPMIGMESMTDPQGYKTTYTYYPNTGKLKQVTDHKGNPVTAYVYKFSNQ